MLLQDEEGGVVKESLLGIAQAKRAANRNKKQGGEGAKDIEEDDTDMPADVDRFEEKLEVEEEGGIKFMPFSLAGRQGSAAAVCCK